MTRAGAGRREATELTSTGAPERLENPEDFLAIESRLARYCCD